MPLLLGLSGKSESGKDTAYALLRAHYGAERVVRGSFADGVREEALAAGAWDGVVPYSAEGRSQLQRWGMAKRADDPDYWVKRLMTRVATLPTHTIVVITDVRFRNEADGIRRAGGLVVRIERPEHANRMTPEQRAHPSETDLDTYEAFDALFINRAMTGYSDRLIAYVNALLKNKMNDDYGVRREESAP